MAANWHLGDVGSTADFSVNASLGHPGALLPCVTRAGGEGCRCPTAGRSWTSLQQRAACWGCNSAFKQSTTIKIRISENPCLRSLSLKKETVENFEPYTEILLFLVHHSCTFLHCFLLSQLETTFGGAINERRSLIEFIIFFQIFTFFSNSCNFSCKPSQLHIPMTISV